jgi:hypothetical protein
LTHGSFSTGDALADIPERMHFILTLFRLSARSAATRAVFSNPEDTAQGGMLQGSL